MYEKKLVDGMVAKGYEEQFAKRVFKQLEGFGSYGFPESHAASFALLVYISSWIKCYYPDVFAAALLNSLPMGFYQPAQIVIDAQKYGVQILPVDINFSEWDNKLEIRAGKYYKLRLGFRQIKGLREEDMQVLVSGRYRPYASIHALLDVGLTPTVLERLANADAFRSIGMDRRKALWEVSALSDRPIGLFEGKASESASEFEVKLPEMTTAEHVLQDYSSTSLSLKAHPISFVRKKLFAGCILSTSELNRWPDGTLVRVAGLVLVRQRPGTASGICFITIEDETGSANLVVFAKLFEKYRKEIIQSRLLMVEGKLQREGEVTHVVVQKCYNMTGLLRDLNVAGKEEPLANTLSRADEHPSEDYRSKDKRKQKATGVQGEIFPASRDFK